MLVIQTQYQKLFSGTRSPPVTLEPSSHASRSACIFPIASSGVSPVAISSVSSTNAKPRYSNVVRVIDVDTLVACPVSRIISNMGVLTHAYVAGPCPFPWMTPVTGFSVVPWKNCSESPKPVRTWNWRLAKVPYADWRAGIGAPQRRLARVQTE